MDISIKHLRSEAKSKVAKGTLILLASFVVSAFIMPAGILVLLAGFVGASIYMNSSIGNIPCPECRKPYGVGVNFVGSIQVPAKCVSCHAQAS